MSNSLLSRAENLNETIEVGLGGWPQALTYGILFWCVYSTAYPSNWLIIFRWPLLSALWSVVMAISILRYSRWSPFYVGPTMLLTSTSILGRGGWTHKKWELTWDQLDHVDWGRNGIFIYRKGLNKWESPYCQVGPFNVSPATLVFCINSRLKAYAENQKFQSNK